MLAGYPPFYDDNPMGIYKKIIKGQYEIPVIISANARDLIQRFLKADCRIRFGCGNVGFVSKRLGRCRGSKGSYMV